MDSLPSYATIVEPPQFTRYSSALYVREPSSVNLSPGQRHCTRIAPPSSGGTPYYRLWQACHKFWKKARKSCSGDQASILCTSSQETLSKGTYVLDFSVKPFYDDEYQIDLKFNYLHCSSATLTGSPLSYKPGRMTIRFVPIHGAVGQFFTSGACLRSTGRGRRSANPHLQGLKHGYCFEAARSKSRSQGTKLFAKQFGWNYVSGQPPFLSAVRLVVEATWFPQAPDMSDEIKAPDMFDETDARVIRLDLVMDVHAFSQNSLLKHWDLSSIFDPSAHGRLTLSKSARNDLQVTLDVSEDLMQACGDCVELTTDTWILSKL